MIRVLAFCLACLPVAAAALTVEDRRGPQDFEAVPERIVVLDWALAEQVLECQDARQYQEKLSDLDFWLRSDHHKRNPGTTADLVGATLFAALREGHLRVPLDTLDLAGVV